MKTRIVAGLVASLALFTATSADAGPKKHAPGGATQHAAISATSSKKAHKTRSASHSKKKASSSATKPASLSTTGSSSATKSASLSTNGSSSATKPASLSTPVTPTHRSSRVSSIPALSRFIASGIPLTEVRDGRLESVGTKKQPCGARSRWAKKGSVWTALDAWGQVAGSLTVSGSDRYDGTGCHQVSFAEGTGKDGLGVFVAKGSGYSPAPSARWNPAGDVVKHFEHLYSAQATAWVDGKTDATADHGKTLFFQLPKQQGSVEGAPTSRRPTHWAVAGGRVLVVAYVGATGAWKVGHVLAPNGKDHAYEPLAVLDMNGDGLPEIVVHEEAGGVFTDRVLSFDAGTMRWEKAVESPGGATP